MEKFMHILHGGQMNGTNPEQMQTQIGKWMAWIDQLAKTDQYIACEPLLPGGNLVGHPGGKTVTDSPYTEGKEVVGAFFTINAKDTNEAVAISKS